MEKKMNKILIGLIFLVQISANDAYANSLEGKFKFDIKAPQVSLVYFDDDNILNNSALSMDQKNKEFTKKMIVGSRKSSITFKNSDNVEHNIYGSLKGKVLFDIGLTSPGSKHTKHIDWDKGNVAKLSCKIHPKMNAWVASVDTKHFSIVEFNNKREKSFAINNIPDKLTKVKIWFPNISEQIIEIKKNEVKQVVLKKGDKSIGTLELSLK